MTSKRGPNLGPKYTHPEMTDIIKRIKSEIDAATSRNQLQLSETDIIEQLTALHNILNDKEFQQFIKDSLYKVVFL